MAAEQRANEDLERDVEARLASMVRSAKAEARSAAPTRPDWTPRDWTAAASKPADFADVIPLDLAKVRTQPRPPLDKSARSLAPGASGSRLMRVVVGITIVLFVIALVIAVLAAVGVL